MAEEWQEQAACAAAVDGLAACEQRLASQAERLSTSEAAVLEARGHAIGKEASDEAGAAHEYTRLSDIRDEAGRTLLHLAAWKSDHSEAMVATG